MTTDLTAKQRQRLENLRRWRDEPQLEHAVHIGNIKAFFREAVDLLDELVSDGPGDGEEFYFLRDSTGPELEVPSWWIYSPASDAWVCFYGDDLDPEDREDAEQTITDVVVGRKFYSMFKGFDEGAARVIETHGISA